MNFFIHKIGLIAYVLKVLKKATFNLITISQKVPKK